MIDGLLLVDKEAGVTSHDVVGMARRALGTRAVGHAGTLDPMATGLLVLGIGEGTKLLRFLESDRKRYVARLTLGAATDSGDADGTVTDRAQVQELSQATVDDACGQFVGAFQQRPPAVSAIKQGGEPLYKKVRRGETVTVPLRDVHVGFLSAYLAGPETIEFEVECSKGFYVRSLGVDLAEALGTLGHLSALRRLRSGAFAVGDAVPMAVVQEARAGAEQARAQVRAGVTPLSTALKALPTAVVDTQGALDAGCGRLISRERLVQFDETRVGATGPLALFDEQGVPLAMVEWHEESLRIVRGFVRRMQG